MTHPPHPPTMVSPMATQITGTVEGAVIHKFQPAATIFRHVIGIKVNQVGYAGHSVRVMAGRARGLYRDNVKLMVRKAVVVKNACPGMTFITESIIRCTLGTAVGKKQLPFQYGRVD